MPSFDTQKAADSQQSYLHSQRSSLQFISLAKDYLSYGYHSQHNFPFSLETEQNDFEDVPLISDTQNDTLEVIADEIRACKKCRLCDLRTNAVPGEGVNNPLVLVVGEGPGEDEDIQGRPFVGKAGQLLDKMLASINLSRSENCFIANIVKCRPPGNRNPHPDEASACINYLERQIALLRPKFILAAGRIAAHNLLKTEEPINIMRGKFRELITDGERYPLLVTYHPSALLRNEEYKRPAWEDLKLLRSRLESIG